MGKSQIIGDISSRISFLDCLISRLSASSERKNGCHVIVSTTRGHVRFYNVAGKADSRTRTYISDESELKRLSTSMYQDRLLEAAINEKRQLERCMGILTAEKNNADIEMVLESIPKPIRDFVNPDVDTDEGYARKWEATRNRRTRKDNAHQFKTDKGDYVRSKSEALIANKLFLLGIPYAYEYDEFFDESSGYTLHPDFTVLNKKTRKEFIWEHCGKMDDLRYCDITIHRLMVFAGYGYLQGNNLLFSYETSDMPLNMDYIEILIKEFML